MKRIVSTAKMVSVKQVLKEHGITTVFQEQYGKIARSVAENFTEAAHPMPSKNTVFYLTENKEIVGKKYATGQNYNIPEKAAYRFVWARGMAEQVILKAFEAVADKSLFTQEGKGELC